MPNAPIHDDVDLHRLAHAQRLGFTFKVNRFGVWISGPHGASGFGKERVVTTALLDEAAIPHLPGHKPSPTDGLILDMMREGPVTSESVRERLGVALRDKPSIFRHLCLMAADGWCRKVYEDGAFRFELTEKGAEVNR